MTLAEYRKGQPGAEPAHGEADHDAGGRAHPGPWEYAQIGIVLAVVTAIEVGIYYIDISHDLLVGILLVLSALKFTLVVLWFMHLRFDNSLFWRLFAGGFALALVIFVVMMATMHGKLV
jgi:cytochrome c oxidase subunit 4